MSEQPQAPPLLPSAPIAWENILRSPLSHTVEVSLNIKGPVSEQGHVVFDKPAFIQLLLLLEFIYEAYYN